MLCSKLLAMDVRHCETTNQDSARYYWTAREDHFWPAHWVVPHSSSILCVAGDTQHPAIQMHMITCFVSFSFKVIFVRAWNSNSKTSRTHEALKRKSHSDDNKKSDCLTSYLHLQFICKVADLAIGARGSGNVTHADLYGGEFLRTTALRLNGLIGKLGNFSHP